MDTNCSCVRRSGTYYQYKSIKSLEEYTIEEKNNNNCSYECNSNCKCGTYCGNRLVQYGPRKDLVVEETSDKGLALYTSKKIPKGCFVCEYAGEIITEAEASKRFKSNTDKPNYIFCIKENYAEKEVRTYIDPTFYGNIGRYINHSCEPNTKLFILRVDDTVPILGIFADKGIDEGSEITYSYGTVNVNNISGKKCFCGTETCKGFLPFDPSVSDTQHQDYLEP
ncbi:unnamed protein product [Acanthoscelides obtectus]|uniref:Uncharacterized protein n=1 Tax=Acanthoscelides obtectus TaxID=200917 RepID=A0A9P0LGC5_ACAOB|nr:unnamed protein product [Acanthoscelides obtectus]CAK1629650.1 Histone-lysine N-methyltransferase SETMAR [Acanthoscelides obtectus]